MRWRELVVGHLRKMQAGRCADCGAGIHAGYQERVRYKIDIDKGGRDEIDNIKLVHSDCNVARVKENEIREIRAVELFRRGRTPREIARMIKITERTVYRYLRSSANRVNRSRR